MRLLIPLALLLAAGCAKLPNTGVGGATKRLVFTLTVQGKIRPDYVYMVALRPSLDLSPTDQGPIPVVAPPWGNGFVAGGVTHFVRWDPSQSPKFLIYKFNDTNLLDFFQIGVPVNYVDVGPDDKVLKFEIDLSQIEPLNTDQYQSIQVNFLTMDHIPSGSGGSKEWDALGDSRLPGEINDYITVPLRTSGVYDNNRFNQIEPSNDARDPDLEITDFKVEVRLR